MGEDGDDRRCCRRYRNAGRKKKSHRTAFQQDLHTIRTGFPQMRPWSRRTRFQRRFRRKVEPQVFGDLPDLSVEAADGSHVLLHKLHQVLVLPPASIHHRGATIP
jgi:hypothetical protein